MEVINGNITINNIGIRLDQMKDPESSNVLMIRRCVRISTGEEHP